ncbi:hypothetical protein [Actinoplanes rectilineatus]|uniref:hypothetical protein n=1 Tax=Actinoplanes rectilineatus TaxID=113571 RepID=UPI0005F27915|nr:hypothetical protein [Actinoplanes rectilineatus]
MSDEQATDPIQPPPDAPKKSKPRRRFPFAAAVALLALLLSGAAVVLSWRAHSLASSAADRIEALETGVGAQPATPTPDVPAPEEPPVSIPAEPTATVSATTPVLRREAQYTGQYIEKALKIPPAARCGDAIFVDLDEPLVQVASAVAEVRFSVDCGGTVPLMGLEGGVTGSVASSEAVEPGGCVDLINYSPLAAGASQPIRQGQVYCVTTSRTAAYAAGITWKMLIVAVTGVAEDETVALRVSAWNIPG